MEFPRQNDLKEDAFLDMRHLSRKQFEEISKNIGKPVFNEKDLKKHMTFDVVKNTGKVGYMVQKPDGGTRFVILDSQYLFRKDYRKTVDRTGLRPVYLRKVLSTKGKTISLDKEVKKVQKIAPLVRFSENMLQSYFQSLKAVKSKVPLNLTRVRKSFKRIIEQGSDVSKKVKESVKEGIRQAILDKKSSELTGKLCRMTGTSSENPDLGHALLEWKVMPCEDVLEHLSRFGCQHDYEIMN